MEVYKNLEKKRKEKKYSYQEMAQELNISKCYYWQLEHKRRKLYYDMAQKIANIFELKPDDLFYEKRKDVDN